MNISEINFEYDASKSWEVCTISLWYYYQGYRKSSSIGTLYSGTINELEEEKQHWKNCYIVKIINDSILYCVKNGFNFMILIGNNLGREI